MFGAREPLSVTGGVWQTWPSTPTSRSFLRGGLNVSGGVGSGASPWTPTLPPNSTGPRAADFSTGVRRKDRIEPEPTINTGPSRAVTTRRTPTCAPRRPRNSDNYCLHWGDGTPFTFCLIGAAGPIEVRHSCETACSCLYCLHKRDPQGSFVDIRHSKRTINKALFGRVAALVLFARSSYWQNNAPAEFSETRTCTVGRALNQRAIHMSGMLYAGAMARSECLGPIPHRAAHTPRVVPGARRT